MVAQFLMCGGVLLVQRLILIALGVIVVLLWLAKEAIDMASRVDWIEQNIPWALRWSESKRWQRVLILVTALMVAWMAYEVWTQPGPPNIAMPSADLGAKDSEIATLKTQNKQLTEELKNARRQNPKGTQAVTAMTNVPPSRPMTGSEMPTSGPSVENMRFIQKGFTEFTKTIDATLPCLVKITAPEDSRRMASEYGQIVSSLLTAIPSKCRVEGPSNLDVDPDERRLALSGIVPAGKVVLHAARTQKGLDGLFSQLSFWTPMEKNFDIPKGSPPNFIWLQFGTGVHWKN
jgi:hypothetical protein